MTMVVEMTMVAEMTMVVEMIMVVEMTMVGEMTKTVIAIWPLIGGRQNGRKNHHYPIWQGGFIIMR
jgi:hypothetical protein